MIWFMSEHLLKGKQAELTLPDGDLTLCSVRLTGGDQLLGKQRRWLVVPHREGFSHMQMVRWSTETTQPAFFQSCHIPDTHWGQADSRDAKGKQKNPARVQFEMIKQRTRARVVFIHPMTCQSASRAAGGKGGSASLTARSWQRSRRHHSYIKRIQYFITTLQNCWSFIHVFDKQCNVLAINHESPCFMMNLWSRIHVQ